MEIKPTWYIMSYEWSTVGDIEQLNSVRESIYPGILYGEINRLQQVFFVNETDTHTHIDQPVTLER